MGEIVTAASTQPNTMILSILIALAPSGSFREARHPLGFPAGFKNRSSKIGSRKLPVRDPQEREQGCRCNAYQRLHLLVAGLQHVRECPWLPPVTTSIKTDGYDTSIKIDGANSEIIPG